MSLHHMKCWKMDEMQNVCLMCLLLCFPHDHKCHLRHIFSLIPSVCHSDEHFFFYLKLKTDVLKKVPQRGEFK